jgi:hypothetical protein
MVTTAATSCPALIMASNAITENSGVPKKTIFTIYTLSKLIVKDLVIQPCKSYFATKCKFSVKYTILFLPNGAIQQGGFGSSHMIFGFQLATKTNYFPPKV